MVKPDLTPVQWTSQESLRLLSLFDAQLDWPSCAQKLSAEFEAKRQNTFFNEKSCKEEFDRITSTGHPEHFTRQKGAAYSQKELINAWITYLQKQVKMEQAREREMLLVKMREKAKIFNRIFSKDNPLSEEEATRLLEEARLEDSKNSKDPEAEERYLKEGMEKITKLHDLHLADPVNHPALQIIIPPSRPSTSSVASTSPIKHVFDGFILPSLETPPKPDEEKEEKTAETSLKSPSHSPQKTPANSPIKEKVDEKTAQEEVVVSTAATKSPEKQSTDEPEKDEALTEIPASAEKSAVVTTPLPSPTKPQSMVGSPPHAPLASPQRAVPPVESIITLPEEPIVKIEPDEVVLDEEIEPMQVDEPSTTEEESKEDEEKEEESKTEAEPEPEPRQLRSSSDATSITDNKTQEKRQLRNSTRISESQSSRPGLRSPRQSPRKASTSEMALRSDVDTNKGQNSTDSRNRRTSTGAQSVESTTVNTDGPPSRSLRNRRSDKGVEPEETTTNRRRSGRHRGRDSSASASETTMIRRKRIRESEDQTVQTEEDSIRGTLPKRRKVSTREAVIPSSSEMKPKLDDTTEVTETRVEVQSSPEPEKEGDGDKKMEEEASVEATETGKKGRRRGSLRSAVVKEDAKKDEAVPSKQGTQAAHAKKTETPEGDESDEDKPLGDIRTELISAKKEEVNPHKTRLESKTPDNEKPKSVEKHRGRPRRDRSGVLQTPTVRRSGTPRTPIVSSRRHPRRDDMDESSIEQKTLMMSVWRMVSSHRHAAIFAQPVSDGIARGYSKAVKSRMDLSTLKKQVDNGKVEDLGDFKRKLLLMFANAVMFNSTGHDVNCYAKEMANDSFNSIKVMEHDLMNMKEGAHLTRSSTANEDVGMERRKRSSYMPVSKSGSMEKQGSKERSQETSKQEEIRKPTEEIVAPGAESAKRHRHVRGSAQK